MLVFGESILNDAVSIVLTRSILIFQKFFFNFGFFSTFQELAANVNPNESHSKIFFTAIGDFLRMMFGSSFLGVVIGLISALISFQIISIFFTFI